MKTTLQFIFSVLFLTLIGYLILYFANISIGNAIDWVVGIISFIWLTTIVVVPWNAHFKAKEVLDDAAISERKNILVIDSSMEYVRKVAKRSLYVAIALHMITAIVLYLVAYWGVSPVGYFSAIAAILLTFFRPIQSFYEYLQKRLGDIRREFRYPREDVKELLDSFELIKAKVEDIEASLETDPKKPSWRQEVDKNSNKAFEKIEQVETLIEQYKSQAENVFNDYKEQTHIHFEKLSEEGKHRFEKLVADSKILESVRTLAGFVKEVRG